MFEDQQDATKTGFKNNMIRFGDLNVIHRMSLHQIQDVCTPLTPRSGSCACLLSLALCFRRDLAIYAPVPGLTRAGLVLDYNGIRYPSRSIVGQKVYYDISKRNLCTNRSAQLMHHHDDAVEDDRG